MKNRRLISIACAAVTLALGVTHAYQAVASSDVQEGYAMKSSAAAAVTIAGEHTVSRGQSLVLTATPNFAHPDPARHTLYQWTLWKDGSSISYALAASGPRATLLPGLTPGRYEVRLKASSDYGQNSASATHTIEVLDTL